MDALKVSLSVNSSSSGVPKCPLGATPLRGQGRGLQCLLGTKLVGGQTFRTLSTINGHGQTG